jgi:hypothetical protein
MDSDLVGYLLKALDPATERKVQDYLKSEPEAQRKLHLLRQALAPLEADHDAFEPAPDLRLRTLALIAEQRVCGEQPVHKAPPIRQSPVSRSRWLRSDVLVAASILLLILPIAPPALYYMRQQQSIAACQNNLRSFYQALVGYSQLHDQRFPMAAASPPRDYAGVVVPALWEGGLLDSKVSIECPGNGGFNPPLTLSLEDLDREQALRPAQFEQDIRRLSGCYAYSLGYQNEHGQLQGLQVDPDDPYLPIMADKPPFEQYGAMEVAAGNSRNHGGKGQNVLRMDGGVSFCSTPCVGIDCDNIYISKNGRPEAGVNKLDTVLGASNFRPYPNPPSPPDN